MAPIVRALLCLSGLTACSRLPATVVSAPASFSEPAAALIEPAAGPAHMQNIVLAPANLAETPNVSPYDAPAERNDSRASPLSPDQRDDDDSRASPLRPDQRDDDLRLRQRIRQAAVADSLF